MKRAFATLYFCCIFTSIGQCYQLTETDNSQFSIFLRKVSEQRDSAEFYLEKAESLAKVPLERMKLNRSWANYFWETEQYDSMLSRVDKNVVLATYKETQATQIELGNTYLVQELYLKGFRKYDEAFDVLFKAKRIFEKWAPSSHFLADCYRSIGSKYWLTKDFNKAEKWWKIALKHAVENSYLSLQSQLNYSLGLVYAKQHQLSLAKEHYQYASVMMLQEDAEAAWRLNILIHNAIGGLFLEIQKADSARISFEMGLEILEDHKDAGGLYKYYKSILSKNMAIASRRLNQYQNALIYSQKALEVTKDLYDKDNPNLIRILTERADIFIDMGNPEKSTTPLKEALRLSKLNNYDIARSYLKLGNSYRQLKFWELANTYYDSSLHAYRTSFTDSLGFYNYATLYGLDALMGKIELAITSKPEIDSDEILALYDEFLKGIKYVYSQTDKLSSFVVIQSTMEKFYRIYSDFYKETYDESWIHLLWEIGETTKAVKLRNRLKNEYSQTYSIPEELLTRGKELRDSINQYLARVKPGMFDSTLFVLKRKYDTYVAQLEKDHPRYYTLKSSMTVNGMETERKQLKNQELMLSFFEGEHTIFLMKISNKSTELYELPKNLLSNWVEEMNQSVFQSSEAQLLNVSDRIKNALMLRDSDLEEFSKLIIIPDGIVWNLNFSALASRTQKGIDYLGNQKNILFRYFADQDVKKETRESSSVLALSFNEKSDAKLASNKVAFRDLNNSLPGTSAEVLSISKLMDGEYYYASEANETAFKRESVNHGILHLAVHGFQNNYNPENSYLKFAAPDSLNDGKLHVYEIYNLDLNADLAVLSACHSGQGKVVTGEGMMSLGRAFAYAGVRSLLISRWEVSDYSAPHLMKYFYEGLKEGMYKSEALKYAQTKYLENHSDALTSSPFYWSSFYVLGDDSPIHQSSATFRPWVIWLLLALILSGGIAIAQRQLKRYGLKVP